MPWHYTLYLGGQGFGSHNVAMETRPLMIRYGIPASKWWVWNTRTWRDAWGSLFLMGRGDMRGPQRPSAINGQTRPGYTGTGLQLTKWVMRGETGQLVWSCSSRGTHSGCMCAGTKTHYCRGICIRIMPWSVNGLLPHVIMLFFSHTAYSTGTGLSQMPIV